MRNIIVIICLSMPLSALAESYPTLDTVQMVVTCMANLGGQTEENLYVCACRHDIVSSDVSFEEYERADLYERYRGMPGERGGMFRDAKEAKHLSELLEKARKKAEQECPLVKHIEAGTSH